MLVLGLAMTDALINREMGRDGGSAAIPSHLSSRREPPIIASIHLGIKKKILMTK